MSESSDLSTRAAAYRDAIKWLAAAFAGVAALVVGTAPFSQIGKQSQAPLILLQVVLLLAALFLLTLAIRLCLWLLSPQAVYRSDLLPETPRPQVEGVMGFALRFGFGRRDEFERRLLSEVLTEIDDHVQDLLPLDCSNRADMSAKLAGARAEVRDEAKRAAAGNEFARLSKSAETMLSTATFLRLQIGVRKTERSFFLLGALVLLLLTGASLLAGNADKAGGDGVQETNVIMGPGTEAQPVMPLLESVRFRSDSADLDAEAWRVLQLARDGLLKHPQSVLLVQAQTDTKAGASYNEGLAFRRCQAVAQALLKVGGVDAGRLFLASLPKTRLPVLTADQVDEAANRVVKLKLVIRGSD